MPDPSNSSFIPKRGPVKKSRAATTKRVYLFTIVSYVLLFSALLASGGVYFYKGVVQETLKEEVSALNSQINTFSDSNMQRVMDFDRRLQQAQSRLDASVSIPSIFSALEESTAGTVKITSLELEREDDERLVLNGEMETDTFDSALFQRRLYQTNQAVETLQVTEFNASGVDGGRNSSGDNLLPPTFTFSVMLDFPLSRIPVTATRNSASDIMSDDIMSAEESNTMTSDPTENLTVDNNNPL